MGCFTYSRRPVVARYAEHFRDVTAAIAYEKQLKGWSRKKKEALFIDAIERLKALSKAHYKSDRNAPDAGKPT